MTASYSFKLTCPDCGGTVQHCMPVMSSLPIWRRQALCECVSCGGQYVVLVELVVSRRGRVRPRVLEGVA